MHSENQFKIPSLILKQENEIEETKQKRKLTVCGYTDFFSKYKYIIHINIIYVKKFLTNLLKMENYLDTIENLW